MRYRLAPFVVGSYEAQAERMDHELAHLVEAYFDDGGTAGIMGPDPRCIASSRPRPPSSPSGCCPTTTSAPSCSTRRRFTSTIASAGYSRIISATHAVSR